MPAGMTGNIPWCVATAAVLIALIAPAAATMGPAQAAIDYPGNNINDGWNTHVNSKEECAALCDAREDCQAATYVIPGVQGPEGHCWLKSAASGPVENYNCYSFTKLTAVMITMCLPPDAGFTASPLSGPAPLVVQFTDQSAYAGDIIWDFGDGQTLNAGSTSHTFTTAGIYTVKQDVINTCGTDSETMQVTVNTACNLVPVADFTPSVTSGSTPLLVRFTDKSTDARLVRWEFGDGQTSTSDNPSHTFGRAGTYTVILRVASSCGSSNAVASKSIQIIVSDAPAPTGEVSFSSAPSGAYIYIDGINRGTTPATVTGIATGNHQYQLKLNGYNDNSGVVYVNAGQKTPVSVTLLPKSQTSLPAAVNTTAVQKTGTTGTPTAKAGITVYPTHLPAGEALAYGTLIVISDPEEASVFIDGESLGTTPLMIENVPAGSHTVLLTLEGYTDVSKTVQVGTGAESQIDVSMTKANGRVVPGFGAALASLVIAGSVLAIGERQRRNNR